MTKDNTAKSMIDQLNVNNEIKDTLHKIGRVASSSNKKMKVSVKDILIVSPSCKELSKIAKCYERIITENSVYPVRGVRTYMELAYPATGKESDLKAFFASPRIVAATQNKFTGVFLISFEQWNSANELIRDSAFAQLGSFIDDNKSNISFVFHVTPAFNDVQTLCNELARHTKSKPYLLEHTFPNRNQAVTYIEKQLKASGLKLDSSGKRAMKKLIDEKIDTTSSSYYGYKTLESFVSSLQFELYANVSKNNEEREELVIGKTEVNLVSDFVDVMVDEKPYQCKMGF